MTKTKKIIFLCLAISLVGIGFLISPTVQSEDEFELLYSIHEDEVEIVNGVPYFYTHTSFNKGKTTLYYPIIDENYIYEDSIGISWMPQKKRVEILRRKYYSKITQQDTFPIFRKASIFEDPNRLFVGRKDGKKILLAPDPLNVKSNRDILKEMEKLSKGLKKVEGERELEKMESEFKKAIEE